MLLPLQRKPIFPGLGAPGSALMRSLFQVWSLSVFFIGFNWVLCDLGVIWAPLGLPLGLLFRVIFKLCPGQVAKSPPGI